MEGLRISEVFADFFDATVDIAHVNINLLDCFAVNSGTETEHTVGSRVLRTDIHHKIVFCKDALLMALDFTFCITCVHICKITLALIVIRHRICFRARVIVLAQRIAFPVNTQE